MARNIEIKASLNDVESCADIAKSLSGSNPEVIKQEDHFFNCDNGRLKLRIFAPDRGELIFYNRQNGSGPKASDYFISETLEPQTLLRVLEKSHGVRGTVTKTRQLFIVGRTRIHIDEVENLGSFIELEVVMSDGENQDIGKQEAYRLMDKLGIYEDSLIDCAYIDLINKKLL